MFYSGSRGDSFQLDATVGATLRLGRQTVGLSLRVAVGPRLRCRRRQPAVALRRRRERDVRPVGERELRVALTLSGRPRDRVRGAMGAFEFNTLYNTPLGASYSAELEGNHITTTEGGVVDRPDRPRSARACSRRRQLRRGPRDLRVALHQPSQRCRDGLQRRLERRSPRQPLQLLPVPDASGQRFVRRRRRTAQGES